MLGEIRYGITMIRCPECKKSNKCSKVLIGISPITKLTVSEILIKYQNYISYTCTNNHSWWEKKKK